MADAKDPENSAEYVHPAYVIGVVGHMDLDDTETKALKAQVKAFLQALIRGEKGDKDMALQLPADWVPLGDTPVVLLSSLAAGADTLAAEAALELRDEDQLNIEVAAPRPALPASHWALASEVGSLVLQAPREPQTFRTGDRPFAKPISPFTRRLEDQPALPASRDALASEVGSLVLQAPPRATNLPRG